METLNRVEVIQQRHDTVEGMEESEAYVKKVAEKQAKIKEEAIAKFRRGEQISHLLRASPTMLRRVGDEIETSRGARVPVKGLDKVWKLVEATRSKQEVPVLRFHMGPYMFDTQKISPQGNIEVGCHKIPYSELKLIAKQLQFI